MTQEEKQLLLKDLCARLPYGVRVYDALNDRIYIIEWFNPLNAITSGAGFTTPIEECKPYLRPMSSMTEEEVFEYLSACDKDYKDSLTTPRHSGVDWLNSHHFDYRGLIEKGLALEAPEGMYMSYNEKHPTTEDITKKEMKASENMGTFLQRKMNRI